MQLVDAMSKSGNPIERAFSLEEDIEKLRRVIESRRAALIVVDPISAIMGSIDSNSNSNVRGLLAPLSIIAGDYSCSVLAITHLRKAGGKAIHRIAESLAFTAASRSTWMIAEDKNDKRRRILQKVKANLSPSDIGGLAYTVEDAEGVAMVKWEPNPIFDDPDELAEEESSTRQWARRRAIEFLKEQLANGPCGVTRLYECAEAEGISRRTLERAKAALDIVAKQSPGVFHGGWTWQLPNWKGPQQTLIP
jgi:RecA-family ATPase